MNAIDDRGSQNDADLRDLRREVLQLIQVAVIGFTAAFLVIAVVDPATGKPEMWFVVVPLIVAIGSIQFSLRRVALAAVLLIATLATSIVAATLVYPGSQLIYALSLLTIISSALLGGIPTFFTAMTASVIVLFLEAHSGGDAPAWSPVMALLMIWSTAILSWLASRPTRKALNWSWRSYLLALARTEELRDRQGELGQLSKDLNTACIRLEQMNAEMARARRAAETAGRFKAEFAATISHELRTPLNLIIGFAEMMIGSPQAYENQILPPDYRHDLQAIHRNAGHISKLIDDVLDLSQIEAHRMALERNRVSLTTIVDDAVSTVAPLFERLKISLNVDVPQNIPELYVDANRVGQILINLLTNAVRNTDDGEVTVRATCDSRDVVISVADTGEGILPEDLPHVFQEFNQVGSPERRRGGSGLGLTVCKRFAEMHCGNMWAESVPSLGSTFYLSLPVCDNVVSAAMAIVPNPRQALERTVVVLDREPASSKVFQRYLDGCHVVGAANLTELRRLSLERPLHAVVLCGPETVTDLPKIETTAPHLRNLPVFTCSLNTPRLLAAELGVSAYLVKPISREHLIAAIRRVARSARDILIVEDDAEMSCLVARFLRGSSTRYRCRIANEGIEALNLMQGKPPDLMLLDLLMPRTNGYDVLRAMRESSVWKDVPVIVITARGENERALRTSTLEISRANGLTVGELMGCLQGSLNALLGLSATNTGSAQPTDFVA